MSIENLERTSNDIKTSNDNLDVLKQKEFEENNPKRTCINTLNQRLYIENKKDKKKNTIIFCIVIFSVGLFGFIIT